jgi:hypothetical protein
MKAGIAWHSVAQLHRTILDHGINAGEQCLGCCESFNLDWLAKLPILPGSR